MNDLVARDAAAESRRLSLPKAEDLKLELPSDFVVPQGVEFKLNENDPILAKGRDFALKHGLTKEGWSELLSIYAGGQVGNAGMLKAARDAELAGLGATATARVTAVQTWLAARLGEDLGKHMATMLVTKHHVEGFEKLIRDGTTQGANTPFSQQHRDTPETNGKIPGYETMTFEQKRQAQDRARSAPAR